MAIQLFVTNVSVFVILKAISAFRTGQAGTRILFAWVAMWLGAIVIVWQPSLTDRVAGFLQVGRGTDAVLYLSLLLIFYLLFRAWVAYEKMRREISDLAREMAILARKIEK